MKVWWCIQTKGWRLERPAGVVCAPEDVAMATYRKTVGGVSKGDIVVHYKDRDVVAFSRAKENAVHFPKLPRVSGENYGSGWRFETEYFDLQLPIHRDVFSQELIPLIVKHYPIDRRGNLRQGYFFPFNKEGLKVVLGKVNEPLPLWLARDC